MTYAPREYGLDLELSNLSRAGGTSMRIEIRNDCFPGGYNPRR